MELERVRQWLWSYPGMERVGSLAVDYLPAVPENGAIAPAGVTELSRREDVLGNVTVEQQACFEVRFVMLKDGVDDATALGNAQWLLNLQQWVQQQCVTHQAPPLGDCPLREQVRAEHGALKEVSPEGTAVYFLRLTFQFLKIYEVI